MNYHFSFDIPGRPVSTNQRLTRGKDSLRFVKTTEYREYKKRVSSIAKGAAMFAHYDIPPFVDLFIIVTKSKIDIDNCLKCILDALEGIAYRNDKDVYSITVRRDDESDSPADRERPNVHVIIGGRDTQP